MRAQRAQHQQGINTKLQCTSERAKTAPRSGKTASRFLCLSLWSKTSHFWRCSRVLRGLTIRSSGAPTAWHTGHQALGLRPILRLLSSVSRRRRPLSSNVRPRSSEIPTAPSLESCAALTPVSQLVKCASRRPAKAGSKFVGHAEYGMQGASSSLEDRTQRLRGSS